MAAANTPKQSCCTRLFVAAIDFGTTYSGYAFSAKHEWTKVKTNIWPSSNQMSSKTPTALLLNPDKTFNSFGYEAEKSYADLAEEDEDEYKNYYYFHRFKMLLHNCKNLHRNICIDDMTRKRMEAHIVFTKSIKYIVDHLFEELKKAYPDIVLDDVQFVLTVPAIWDDPSKQFMREAATAAGINANQLLIALEPEAASIYCQHIPTEVGVVGTSSFLRTAKQGTKYMIVDLGGGTADITVHLRSGEGVLDEVRPASGGPWGGKSVDDKFEKFMKEILGEEVMDKLKTENMEDYLDLFREFESKKRNISTVKTGKVHMKVPLTVKSLAEKKMKKNMTEILKESNYGESVHFANMKLHMAIDVFKDLFKPTIDGIVKHLKEVFMEKNVHDVETILMVGGFSECELVQTAIKNNFKDKRVIIPEDAGLAVLKGAVYYGHVPKTIGRRVARYTYGIQSWPEFDPSKHPDAKKVMIGTTARCRDVFFKYVTKGELLTPGYRRSQIFQALKPDEECLECAIYVSDEENPVFVDDASCRKLGTLRVPLPRVSVGCSLEIEETMIFGDTELEVQARDIYTNQQCEVSIDLLSNNVVQNGN
ncbi:heat shock 70 kDa protein 12A-like [Saccostrea echinata]|uniref:heat shock 70 kDa protein 12A-like n=1 Tax=Saccostrea echinata TaxID=191078 RepID=UPI002A7EFC9B|nr:heat shock 70 kDa protein 12A-like [Saccostrea echinata]